MIKGKSLLAGFFFGLLFVLCPKGVFAADVNQYLTGRFMANNDGVLESTFRIETENLSSEVYVDRYNLYFKNLDLSKIRKVEGGEITETSKASDGEGYVSTIELTNPVVGKNKTHILEISYNEESLIERSGTVWEISLPKVGNFSDFKSVDYEVYLPHSFGEPAYISPEPLSIIDTQEYSIYYFDKESLSNSNVSLAFGEFQVFNFELNYHLVNPVNREVDMEIAIPPDTLYQRVIYEQIDPSPFNVRVDADGNYLASYKLSGKERMDVRVVGGVQLYPGVRQVENVEIDPQNYLRSDEYWEVFDPKIIELSKIYSTPWEIYNFVVNKLSYDYDRVQPNIKRKGALRALDDPSNSICMEFTDLFVAISRAAGIPAREVNGYAHTENPELQPLSLVADVLHSWPEYWDFEKKIWVPVDPTWADTTGGDDYFNKLDLRHFTFVMHGIDSEEPYPPGSYKLGANPQKDVFISLGELPDERDVNLTTKLEKQRSVKPFSRRYLVTVGNSGNITEYNYDYEIYFDERIVSSETIKKIPPYGSSEIEIEVPLGFLGINGPDEVRFVANNKTVEIATNKIIRRVIAATLVSVVLLLISFLLFKRIKTRK